MVFHLPEPDRREDKPGFAKIPQDLLNRISNILRESVIAGDIVYGGFSPSAGYCLTVESGKRFFAKGTHPEEMSHGTETLRQEIKTYQTIDVLKEIAPAYKGMVEDGNEDGWMMGLWDYIPHGGAALTGTDIVDVLIKLQQDSSAGQLQNARDKNYISFFFETGRKWQRIADDKKIREKFLSLFADTAAAAGWLDRNLEKLVSLQEQIGTVQEPCGLLHGDLRLDNLIKDVSGRISVIDWPNACAGPLIFDAVFLFAHAAAMGIAPVSTLFALYEAHGGQAVLLRDRHVMMAAISGLFADQAYRQVPERLPRLRWMQKMMLYGLLTALHLDSVIESPPEFAG